MAQTPLLGVRLKIERSQKHVCDLEAAIRAFYESGPYKVATKRDPESRRLIHYIASVEDAPPTIPLVAGDAIQCLRSALDQLAYQLFVAGGGVGDGRHVYFPIFDSAAKYEAQLLGKVEGMSQAAIDAIGLIEPYQGGKGHDLWVLHRLNNIDKHRLLITVGTAYRGVNTWDGDMRRMMDTLPPKFADVLRRIGPRMEGMWIREVGLHCPPKVGDVLYAGAPDELDDDPKFSFYVSFSEPGVIERKPIVPTLHQLTQFVENVVDQLRRLL